MPCGHVVGVAGFQLVVQALHQLILCSGCDYLHASLHVAQLSFSLVRRKKSLGRLDVSGQLVVAGGSGVTVLSCGSLPGSSAGTEAESQGSGPGVIGLRLDCKEARLLAGLPEVLLPERSVKCWG